MHTLNLRIKTLSPIVNFEQKPLSLYAIKKDVVFLINGEKLRKILSVLNLSDDFNEYLMYVENGNITNWLRGKNLLTKELLFEVAESGIVYSSQNDILKNKLFGENLANTIDSFNRLMKNNVRNFIVFKHILKNTEQLNRYVSNLLNFFQKNNVFEYKKYSFQFFMNCLFEAEKFRLYKDFCFDEKIDIYCENVINEEKFCIEKVSLNNDDFYYKCLKCGLELDFALKVYAENVSMEDVEGYLKIVKKFAKFRFIAEKENCFKEFKNVSENKITSEFSENTISFCNLNQIFYFALNEENKALLNEMIPNKMENYLFCYLYKNRMMRTINYADIVCSKFG